MKLYISPDLGTNMSGNTVSTHELQVLQSLGDSVIQIGQDHMNPVKFGLPNIPFLQDYLAMDLVSRMELNGGKDTLAMLYAGPFANTIRYLKAKGLITINSYAAHDRMESIKEFENLGYQYPYQHIKDDYLWNIYFQGVKEADIVICPSMLSAEFLKNEGVDNRNIRIIPHGTKIPDNCEVTNIPNQFNIGYLGQCGPDKGLRYLIEAWSNLDYKDNTLILGGQGTDQLSSFINKYATTNKFNLLGYVKDVDIEKFYNNISVYVQPSITESFGIEILEAMSYGRPVIASKGAGASELINNGVNGFVVPKRDPKAIADKIQFLKDNPKELTEMGIAARESSLDYSWDKIRSRYIDIFASI